jgi:hypothetical protein
MGLVLVFDADDTLWENNIRIDRVVPPRPKVENFYATLGRFDETMLIV